MGSVHCGRGEVVEMRGFLLWCMLGLAVVARAQEEQVAIETSEDTNDLTIDEDVEAHIDVQRMMRELFEFTAEDDEEHDSELGINRQDRAMSDSEVEARAVVEPEDQARYNKFMDTFYRRLNADARTTIDPLGVPLPVGKNRKAKNDSTKKVKKGGSKKKDTEKNGAEKDSAKKDGAKKDGAKKDDKKKTKKQKNNKKNKNNKNKKTARNPKFMNLEEDEDEIADEDVVVAWEEELHAIVKRDATMEAVEEVEEVGRSTDLVEEDEDEEDAVTDELARRIPNNKNNKKKNKNNKAGRKNKNNKNKNKNKNNKNKNNKSKAKRSTKKNHNKKGKSDKKKGPQTSRASVSGIATLRRQGDVSVVNRKDGKELRSAFTIGPVDLKINRKFGSGKDAVVRSATASAPELTGQMNLYVAANGKAQITKFTIARPSVVTTSGNLNKDENKRSGNNNFMEMSIARSTPLAAKKLKLAARDVLQATESKN